VNDIRSNLRRQGLETWVHDYVASPVFDTFMSFHFCPCTTVVLLDRDYSKVDPAYVLTRLELL